MFDPLVIMSLTTSKQVLFRSPSMKNTVGRLLQNYSQIFYYIIDIILKNIRVFRNQASWQIYGSHQFALEINFWVHHNKISKLNSSDIKIKNSDIEIPKLRLLVAFYNTKHKMEKNDRHIPTIQ